MILLHSSLPRAGVPATRPEVPSLVGVAGHPTSVRPICEDLSSCRVLASSSTCRESKYRVLASSSTCRASKHRVLASSSTCRASKHRVLASSSTCGASKHRVLASSSTCRASKYGVLASSSTCGALRDHSFQKTACVVLAALRHSAFVSRQSSLSHESPAL